MVDAAMGAQMVGNAGTGFFEQAFEAAADAAHLMAQFRQNTMISSGDLTAIRSKADALTVSVPGTTISENLHTILDAYTITGQISEALNAAAGLAKARLVFESLPGAHRGDSAFAAGQAIEVLQRFYDPATHQVDMGAFNAQLAAMTRVAVGTGGRVSGDSYLAFAKQARLGGMLANDDFLYGDLPALLIALGGSRSGTGDAATYKQFLQGKMTANAFGQLQDIGLLDKSAKWQHGQVLDMKSHLQGAGEFIVNPAAWVRDVLMSDLAKHGVDPNNRTSVVNSIGQWSSTNTGLGFLLELALGMPGILKEKGKIATTNADPLSVIQQSDPLQKMREFHAAETNFLTTLGDTAMGPALDALKALTTTLRNLTEWAKANPTAAKDLMLLGGGLSLVAKVVGDAALAIWIGAPLVTGLKALALAASPFKVGAEAASGLTAVAAGLAGVASGIAAIASAITVFGFAYNAFTESDKDRRQEEGHHFRVPRPGANVYQQSFHSSMPNRPLRIENVLYLDGKQIYRGVMRAMGEEASAPTRGVTGFDPRMTPTPTGATVGA